MSAKVVWRGPELQALLIPEVRAALEDVAQRVEARTKAATPVRTGAARDSVHSSVETSGDHIEATVGGSVPYFIWLELGSRGRPGIGMLQQGITGAAAEIRAALKGLI